MLPPDLLRAITAPGGSKVALVLGAGCSLEAPTSLPLARECSKKAHQRLMADKVLVSGDCVNPDDLSCLADAVFKKTKSQEPLVTRMLDAHEFKKPTPNEGYLIAAALLFEGAIGAVVTLNFDLALTMALSHIGVDAAVAVIDGPHELGRQSNRNVYYLHRNANAVNPDDWVLRTEVIKEQWKSQWEQHVIARALTAPVVVFAGLGSPAAVLLESAKIIRAAIKNKVLQVDPGGADKSEFFKALNIGQEAFLKFKWCEFMRLLGERVLEQQLVELWAAITTKSKEDNLAEENHENLFAALKSMGLLGLGRFRAATLLLDKPYSPDLQDRRGLIADLLQAIAMIERVSGVAAKLHDEGVVEFVRDGSRPRFFFLASGRGSRGRPAIEAAVKERVAALRNRIPVISGGIIGGTSGWTMSISPPADLILGSVADSIVAAPLMPDLIHLDDLRSDPASISKVVL